MASESFQWIQDTNINISKLTIKINSPTWKMIQLEFLESLLLYVAVEFSVNLSVAL